MYIIKIKTNNYHGCWLRSFHGGDPDRTLIRENALKFAKKKTATEKVKMLNKEYENRNFEIEIY